jgi:6-phospho-beta-glucosidase
MKRARSVPRSWLVWLLRISQLRALDMTFSRKTHIDLALLGGGVWVVELIEQLARSRVLPSMTVRMAARDQDRLKAIVRHCDVVATRIRKDCAIIRSESLEAAVSGVDAAVCMIRVGGYPARVMDETFPGRFESPGDEGLGCGGLANACRSIPVVAQLCDAIRAHAPKAKVLNLMAPLGVTTRVFLDQGLDAVGICELPSVTEKKLLDAVTGTAPTPEYGGFNHLGWFWARSGSERAVLERAAVSANIADPQSIRRFEAIPLWYYYKLFDPAAGTSLGLLGNSNGRAQKLGRLSDSIVRELRANPGDVAPALKQRFMPWFSGALVPILEAVFGGEPYEGFLNLRNDSLIPQLGNDAIVEVRASISGTKTMPVGCHAVPGEVLRFLKNIEHAEEEAYLGALALNSHEKLQRLSSAVESLKHAGLKITSRSPGDVAAEILRCSA